MSSVPQAPRSGADVSSGGQIAGRLARSRILTGLALATVLLGACVGGGPPRPTTPTYTANQRPEPARPPRPGDPLPLEEVVNPYASSRSAYVPRHLAGADVASLKRVAVMLPFSATDPEVKSLAEGLFNAIQMAMFEIGATDVVLIPKDANADTDMLSANAREAVAEGAVAAIGPLFAQHVPLVAAEMGTVRAPVLAFSTDVSAQGQGAYLMSLTPATEVERIVDWASQQGVTRFAMFGPNSAYGRMVEAALREHAEKRGARVITVEYYNPGDTAPQAAAKRLADVVNAETAATSATPGQVAVLIPERGVQLRTVASLIPYFDVDLRQVKFLGTGAWNDPEVWREPSLYGGAFPAPDPAALADFDRRYQAMFGEAPPRLASFGYDAGALIATLARAGRLDGEMLQREQGWSGVNGLFRFDSEGGVQRGLAVMQIQERQGARIVSPAIVTFGPGS